MEDDIKLQLKIDKLEIKNEMEKLKLKVFELETRQYQHKINTQIGDLFLNSEETCCGKCKFGKEWEDIIVCRYSPTEVQKQKNCCCSKFQLK